MEKKCIARRKTIYALRQDWAVLDEDGVAGHCCRWGRLHLPSADRGLGEGTALATSYYPVIFAGCLMRMADADTDRLVLLGTKVLSGERVYHLVGPGGSSDALELEYWLGVADGLPRQAVVRTRERPGWSDEAYTIQITATLRLSNDTTPTVIEPPTRATS
jgi:hypothetical protein